MKFKSKIYPNIVENKKQIIKLSKDLTKSYGLVFNMYFLDGMTHKEISQKLNISEGTSKSNLHKAKKKIKQKIKQAIKNYEPRAEVLDISTNYIDYANSLDVSITFLILSTNETITLETEISRLR